MPSNPTAITAMVMYMRMDNWLTSIVILNRQKRLKTNNRRCESIRDRSRSIGTLNISWCFLFPCRPAQAFPWQNLADGLQILQIQCHIWASTKSVACEKMPLKTRRLGGFCAGTEIYARSGRFFSHRVSFFGG